MQKYTFLSLLGIFLLSACATRPKVTQIKDLSNSPSQELRSGILISVNLETGGNMVARDGCTLYLARSGEMKDYKVDVKPGSTDMLTDLPEGNYRYKSFYCGSTTWNLVWDHSSFQVFTGKISLLSGLHVKILNTRHAHIVDNDRNKNREVAIELLQSLKNNPLPVVSAYTGQGIELTQVMSPAHFKNWDFYQDGSEISSSPQKDWPKFKDCYQAEKKVNPLWLGSADFESNYQNEAFQNLKQKDNWHTFTATFLECAKNKLSAFRPKHSGAVRYGIYL